MTTGYICDRCGETFTGGGRWLQGGYKGNSTPMQSWDLCPDCMEGFAGWMDGGQESQDVTGSAGCVTDDGEMLHDRIAELEAQLADAREALDAVWSERDQWRDAYRDSERLRLELVKDLEHARKWNDTWRDLVHRYEGLCDGLLDERDAMRGEA